MNQTSKTPSSPSRHPSVPLLDQAGIHGHRRLHHHYPAGRRGLAGWWRDCPGNHRPQAQSGWVGGRFFFFFFFFFLSNQRQWWLSPFYQVPCNEIDRCSWAALMSHKVVFLSQVEREEIESLSMPKGHNRKGDSRQFLWDCHKESMLMLCVLLSYIHIFFSPICWILRRNMVLWSYLFK